MSSAHLHTLHDSLLVLAVSALLRLQSVAMSRLVHLLPPVCNILIHPLLFSPGQNAIFVFRTVLLLLFLELGRTKTRINYFCKPEAEAGQIQK